MDRCNVVSGIIRNRAVKKTRKVCGKLLSSVLQGRKGRILASERVGEECYRNLKGQRMPSCLPLVRQLIITELRMQVTLSEACRLLVALLYIPGTVVHFRGPELRYSPGFFLAYLSGKFLNTVFKYTINFSPI
jgi:hypothetical protein